MRIGIFLGYGPQTKLGKEGLGRYLAGILKGFEERGEQITIACPKWLLGTLSDLFSEFQIDKKQIKWITTKRTPVIWEVLSLFKKKPNREFSIQLFINWIRKVTSAYIKRLAKVKSIFVFMLYSLLLLIIGLAILPFLIISGILLCILIVIWKFIKLLSRAAKEYAKAMLQKRKQLNRANINRFQLKSTISELYYEIKTSAYYSMSDTALNSLVKIINNEQEQDVWFVPAIFWPQANQIQATVVFNAPDLVSGEFPVAFADVFGSAQAIERCRETILSGKYFITYCEYIRQTLLIEEFGKRAEHTVAIRHINNDMSGYLAIAPQLREQMHINKDLDLEYARNVLFGMGLTAQPYDYMQGIDLRHIHYLFYASQIRPSKNMMGLVKAYEYILRRRYIGHKLFLTCNLRRDAELYNYVIEHGLDHDIICFFNVSAVQLAALYKCADLVVNPTLYEGGFPFTFGEGMSVGTPSIMSDIPQVREIFEPAGLGDCMFDPYDWMDIATKIEYGILKREEILTRQMTLYNELRRRTADVVAFEYIQELTHFKDLAINSDG